MNCKGSLATEYLDEYQILKQLGSGYQAMYKLHNAEFTSLWTLVVLR